MQPLYENSLSTGAEVAGIDKFLNAIRYKIENLFLFKFQNSVLSSPAYGSSV